ncbi:MAG TPA: MoxR family ATPase [Verrucomicrobia bacterium]|nr:MoxR family ATPase [Verrucomicrobiota bacterium]
MAAAEESISRLRHCCEELQKQMGSVLVGQQEVTRLLLTGLVCGGHMLVIGVPGLAKTMMVKALADLLGWEFRRIQFTPDLMPADITGTEILQADESGRRRELVFHRGPIFANLILADEINRTPPKTQAALLEAMQELAVTVNGKTYRLESPFIVVATQNPIEQEGTYPLPEAQLDRFLFSIHVDYPAREEEVSIAGRPLRAQWNGLTPVARKEDFRRFTEIVDQMPVSRHVLEQAVAITTASRPKGPHADDYVRRYVAWGAGPRATQHLVTAAKAAALLDGRPAPETSDLHRVALPVLRHRIIPNYNALGEGIESDAIVRHLLKSVGEPALVS